MYFSCNVGKDGTCKGVYPNQWITNKWEKTTGINVLLQDNGVSNMYGCMPP